MVLKSLIEQYEIPDRWRTHLKDEKGILVFPKVDNTGSHRPMATTTIWVEGQQLKHEFHLSF